MVLFVGGPLHGTSHKWDDPPDYHPHVTTSGMVPYSRQHTAAPEGFDPLYAPVGMAQNAILESLARLSIG